MLIKRGAALLLLFIGLACHSHSLYGVKSPEQETITYYLYISDFADSFIEIPTSNVTVESPTIASSYLAGRAPIYDVNNMQGRNMLCLFFIYANCRWNLYRYIQLFICC